MKCFSCGSIGTMVHFKTVQKHPVYRCTDCGYKFWEWPRKRG